MLKSIRLSLALGLACLLGATSQAVILYRSGDPAANTTAPGAAFPHHGWDYQGAFGGFLATPIAPRFFIAAAHVGNAGSIYFQNASHTVVQSYPDPATDLIIYRVAETFPLFAPMYSGTAEAGETATAFGRGTQRGSELSIKGMAKGWAWGAGDGVFRWGQNVIETVFNNGTATNQLLVADFNSIGRLTEECHLSSGDSSGGLFLDDGGVWKLAGIHYAVDGPFYTAPDANTAFNAALHDARGYYYFSNGQFVEITGILPQPSAFYSTRISNRLPWICSVIAAPEPGLEPGYMTLTYTRLILPTTDIVYEVEQSEDLVTWEVATVVEEQVSVSGDSEVILAKVDRTGLEQLFLRLRVRRP